MALLNFGGAKPITNRASTYAPSRARMAAITGAAASVERLDNTVAPAKAPIAPGPAILVTTRQSTFFSFQCDRPEAMLVPSSEKCTDADAAAGLARAETVLAAWPGTRRTWLRFRDGRFSGCNLFWLGTPGAAGAVAFWRRVEQDRKRPLAMIALLGPPALLRFALGRLTLADALAALGRRTGTRLAAVEMPFAEAAIDVDRPADLALAEAALASRAYSAA